MSNFELIDEYLTNRLGELERVAFEEKLVSDPALRADMEFQRQVLEGVKKARIAELKAILNNVAVGGGVSSGLTGGKIAAGIVMAGIVITGIYLYVTPKSNPGTEPASQVAKPQREPAITTEKSDEVITDEKLKPVEQPVVTEVQKQPTKKPVKKPAPNTAVATQPKIEVVDPSEELVNNSSNDATSTATEKANISTSHITVEAIPASRKYNFHYQFQQGKLVLYGPFDRSLYEILEINGDQHLVFLFYKDNFYVLDEKQQKIVQLQPIKDASLLKKLKEYRARQ